MERRDPHLRVENRQVILKDYVTGFPEVSDMELKSSVTLLALPDEHSEEGILLKNLYLSLDPYVGARMHKREGYESYDTQPIIPGSPLSGYGVSKVVASNNPAYKEGDLVWGLTGWEEYTLITDSPRLVLIPDTTLPLSFYTGILGMPGMTAYAGFNRICEPKKGENVFISAASGSVGQLVGQFAKLEGCYVVGSAGSDEKAEMLKSKLGFDGAFNYKKEEEDMGAVLKRYFPAGIDIYYENVGGKMLDAVLPNMRLHGRISVCGMVSQYHLHHPDPVYNLHYILTKRLRMQGFLVPDFYHLYPHYLRMVLPLIKQNKIVYEEETVEGLGNAPLALINAFRSRNIVRQILVVARD